MTPTIELLSLRPSAEFILNTAIHSLLFAAIVAMGYLAVRRLSPHVVSGGLSVALAALIIFPLVHAIPTQSLPSWWQWTLPRTQAVSPVPQNAPTTTQAVPTETAVKSLPPATHEPSPKAQPAFTASSVAVTNLVGALWLIGSLIMIARLLLSIAALHRFKRKLHPVTNPSVQNQWQALLATRSGRPTVTLSQLDKPCSPFAIGLIKTHVVLPSSLIESGSPEEIQNALLHELNHIEHRDLWFATLQRIVIALYWWNPIIHWIERQFNLSREMLCDMAVIQETGNPRAYATALVSLADRLQGFSRVPEPSARMASSFSLLEKRIKNIATNKKSMKTQRIRSLTWTASALALLLAIATLGVRATWAKPPRPSATFQSGGNESVRIEVTETGIQVAIVDQKGRTRQVEVPITNEATADQLSDLINSLTPASADETSFPTSDSTVTRSSSTESNYNPNTFSSSTSFPAASGSSASSGNAFSRRSSVATPAANAEPSSRSRSIRGKASSSSRYSGNSVFTETQPANPFFNESNGSTASESVQTPFFNERRSRNSGRALNADSPYRSNQTKARTGATGANDATASAPWPKRPRNRTSSSFELRAPSSTASMSAGSDDSDASMNLNISRFNSSTAAQAPASVANVPNAAPNQALLEAIEKLTKRIQALEQKSRATTPSASSSSVVQ